MNIEILHNLPNERALEIRSSNSAYILFHRSNLTLQIIGEGEWEPCYEEMTVITYPMSQNNSKTSNTIKYNKKIKITSDHLNVQIYSGHFQ